MGICLSNSVFPSDYDPIARRASLSTSPEFRLENCVICCNSPNTHAYVPCGHKILCGECMTAIKKKPNLHCVLCRQKYQQIIRIYD